MVDLNDFISQYVTCRRVSLFENDIKNNIDNLSNKIKNKTMLVIGGAGSIGSSFIKTVLEFKPSSLVVVDINENSLAELTRDIRSEKNMYVPEDYMPYPMDYSSDVFEKMFRARKGFDIVANFSAHKHVRSEKDIYSVEVLLRNNLINAKKLLDLLVEFPPEEYFCVSTDKAANPVNIMGASKRIMEDMIFAYSDKFPVKTARFANVAFSNGSLPDGFLKRIQKLQPLSAPLDIKRYFVSPEESGQICMLACMLGDNRDIFFPKLQESQMMSFDLIAMNLLKCYGYEIDLCKSEKDALEKIEYLRQGSKNYPVFFSKSDTSGEKMYEEFYTENEVIDVSRYSSLGVITNKAIPDINMIISLFNNLNKIFNQIDFNKNDIIKCLKEYLSNFNHIETSRSLDSKM